MTGPPRFRYPRGALGLTDEESIGPHRIRVVGDTVLTRYIGVPELAHVQAIHQRFDRVIAEHGRLYVVNDMSRSGIPSSETRRWIAEPLSMSPGGSCAFSGGASGPSMRRPDKLIVVEADGSVVALAFDPKHGRVTGVPVAVLDHVRVGSGPTAA